MRIATTTGDFNKVCDTHAEKIRALYDCGFRYIDLSLYDGAREDWEYFADDWKEKVEALRSLGEELGIKYVQCHAPGGNPLTSKPDKYDLLLRSTIRSLEICQMLGIPNCVYHAGWRTGIEKEEYFKENRKFVQDMIPTMEKTGVNLCVENSTKANMKDMYYFFDGEDMAEFIDWIGHPRLKACWDTGHANIEGHQYKDLIALGDRLTTVHINDNLGEKDQHMHPYIGTVNMDEVMHGLLDAGFKGYFTFECQSVVRDNYWLHKRHRYDADTRALNPSFHIVKKMTEVTYAIGEYVLSQYGCFEE